MANQIIWAMRSDNANFNARYSPSGLTPGLAFSTAGGASPVYEADAGAIGGNRYNLGTTSAAVRSLTYPGQGIFNTKTISILIRAQVLSSALLGMYDICGEPSLSPNRFAFYQNASVWKCVINNKSGSSVSNSPSLATQSPDTTHYADFVMTWDGTTTANKIMFWYNGTNLGNATASTTWANPQDATLTSFINVGAVAGGVANVNMYVNEMVIWNYVIDPTTVVLTSSTGALNGSSRTQFVNVAAFDGTLNSDPDIANVRSATAYTIAGAALTGTAAIPTAANVRSGTATDATTGTLAVPTASNVRLGISIDNTTGTLVVPSASDVRLGTAVATTTGTLDLPMVSVVLTGTVFDNTTKTGTLAVPTAAQNAAAVWDEATSGHTTAGSFGVLMKALLTLAQFLGLK